MGFPSGSDDKECACNAEDPGLVPGLGRNPGEENGNPVFLPGEFQGKRSLAGCSTWGCKELDATEQLTHIHTYTENKNSCWARELVEIWAINLPRGRINKPIFSLKDIDTMV